MSMLMLMHKSEGKKWTPNNINGHVSILRPTMLTVRKQYENILML